jgi:hypothetical protein
LASLYLFCIRIGITSFYFAKNLVTLENHTEPLATAVTASSSTSSSSTSGAPATSSASPVRQTSGASSTTTLTSGQAQGVTERPAKRQKTSYAMTGKLGAVVEKIVKTAHMQDDDDVELNNGNVQEQATSFRREELVRLLIQSVRSLGYR